MNDNFIVFLLMSLGYGYFDSIPHFRYYAYHYAMQNYIYIGMIKSCHTKEGEHRY